ncbi:MAG: phosphofructokinase [Desulfatitalea sp.]|nr:6-phosphofructokinase [Desulfatitalea sp.]NNK01620.1 phosphofructokinase [Desulfatitalea sp.]
MLAHPDAQRATSAISEPVKARCTFKPRICDVFQADYTGLTTKEQFRFEIDPEARRQLPKIINNKVQTVVKLPSPDDAFVQGYTRPRRIGIVFSGGPAPGGHNVIAGLYDAAKRANPDSRLFGFLVGPDGIIENEYVELTDDLVNAYRNLGGFTMIKTGRTKIDTADKMAAAKATITSLKLDALVVVGGDDSNTNAAFLAQELYSDSVQIIGVPKTIDGDIQVRDADGNILCAMSFGFHSAARAFASAISNLSNDSSSDIKYWHICRVMGRVASHLALEVALQTHANLTLIGEDLADYVDEQRLAAARAAESVDYTAYGMTLRHLSRVICDAIVRRAAVGKNYGIVVIPEGILEFINEIEVFIIKLNTIIAQYNATHDQDFHASFPLLEQKLDYLRHLVRDTPSGLAPNIWNARDDELFNDLPTFFQEGLLTERDSHGNFQFSQVPTEKVLLDLVKDYLKILRDQGKYKIGIHKHYYSKILSQDELDPEYFGPILFRNYGEDEYLLVKERVISLRTLKNELIQARAIGKDAPIPPVIEKIYKKSVPNFKTQSHFYGYDGRGTDPTLFDCTYTYNLGLTVFSLIANGATGQMASIRNLEHGFELWEPMGLPIAPLMRLEERKGKLTLVLEKSLVDINSPAFQVAKTYRDKWLAATSGDDQYRRPGPIRLHSDKEEDRPITLLLNAIGQGK